MTDTLSPAQLRGELAQFRGSEQFYRHGLNRSVVYTEGVQFLAENAQAYWLIDAVASYVGSGVLRAAMQQDRRLEWLQFWRLDVTTDRSAVLTCRADDGVPPAITQNIEFTDFPLDSADIWAGFDGTFWTLYLPSEH